MTPKKDEKTEAAEKAADKAEEKQTAEMDAKIDAEQDETPAPPGNTQEAMDMGITLPADPVLERVSDDDGKETTEE